MLYMRSGGPAACAWESSELVRDAPGKAGVKVSVLQRSR